nr:DUF2147 domain-containing protein [Cytophagales bacterium]
MLTASLLALLPLNSQAQAADAILGKWYTQDKDAQVEIFKERGGYHGKMVWLKEPVENGKPKLDKNNPDESKRGRPILGMRLLLDFVHEGDAWEGGKIYDPRSGKSYSGTIKLLDDGKMEVRGYVGFAALGKSVVWSRVK